MKRIWQKKSFITPCLGMIILFYGPGGVWATGNSETPLTTNDSVKQAISKTIVKEDLEKHLKIISSDAYEGRETGTKGQKLTAKYLADCFKGYNIEPLNTQTGIVDGYFHQYKLIKKQPLGISIKTSEKTFVAFDDFYYNPRKVHDTNTTYSNVHFLGYGINDTAYNDYKSIEIKENEIGIILSGEPRDKQGKYFISSGQHPSSKADNSIKIKEASSQGLGCVLIVIPDIEQSINRYKSHFLKPSLALLDEQNNKNPINCFYISYDMADEILGLAKNNTTISKLEKKITIKKAPQSKTFGLTQKIELISERKHEIVTSENVMGFIEGGDKKEEIVILTAHYDHLGIKDSIIYNGADDDGSGTVALLELAEAFAKAKAMGYGPRRSILFMPVSGEEKGLLGSKYYTDNPVFPLENTIANLNIDMIGRRDTNYKDDPNYVYIIGADRLSQDLHNINENANSSYTQIKLDYRFNHADDPNRFYYRSDHYNFAKNDIPVIFYFTGVHEDYHKPTDTIDKIEFNKMENIVRLIYFTAWELANRDERIKLDKKNN